MFFSLLQQVEPLGHTNFLPHLLVVRGAPFIALTPCNGGLHLLPVDLTCTVHLFSFAVGSLCVVRGPSCFQGTEEKFSSLKEDFVTSRSSNFILILLLPMQCLGVSSQPFKAYPHFNYSLQGIFGTNIIQLRPQTCVTQTFINEIIILICFLSMFACCLSNFESCVYLVFCSLLSMVQTLAPRASMQALLRLEDFGLATFTIKAFLVSCQLEYA